jgi:hypothetical protein
MPTARKPLTFDVPPKGAAINVEGEGGGRPDRGGAEAAAALSHSPASVTMPDVRLCAAKTLFAHEMKWERACLLSRMAHAPQPGIHAVRRERPNRT